MEPKNVSRSQSRGVSTSQATPPKNIESEHTAIDEVHPTRRVARAMPWTFKRSQADIRYTYRGSPPSLTDFLSRDPVTALLIAQDDQILFEHYQYARTDLDRFNSGSMAKSITGMLIGIAISESAIKSVDDTAETYVPGFKGTEYGRTPIRDLLHISSGVDFGEDENRDGRRDLDRLWDDMVTGSWIFQKGTIGSIAQFNRRLAPPGTRYHYASIEPDVLGVVLRNSTNGTMSDLLQEKIWQPVGAEADAAWLLDAEGHELAHSFFNAVLRDYARLGRLLAHGGRWDSGSMDDRRNDRTRIRHLSGSRASSPRIWLRISSKVVSRVATAIRAARRSRAAHLCRPGLEACHGSDGCRTD
jgi:CubicO group peptidase (beta-lactamase class C family)